MTVDGWFPDVTFFGAVDEYSKSIIEKTIEVEKFEVGKKAKGPFLVNICNININYLYAYNI